MATKIFVVGSFLFFFANFAHSSVFDSIFDDVSSCKEVCRNTFTPHTFEKSNSEECCDRGCRLFSMVEFIYDDVNKTTQVCMSSCKEAYTDVDEMEACKLGCKNQKPFTLDGILKDDPWEQHIHLVDPVSYMHSWYSNVFNNIMSQASVSWTMYVKESDGSVVIVKSPPQYKLFDITDNSYMADDEYNTASYMETNIEPMDNSATPFLKNSPYKAHRNDDYLINLSARDLDGDKTRSRYEDHADWLSCVAKKTGLPRLLLSWLLLMSAVVMIWLCLSAAVTSPEHRIYTEPQKLSINGDQEIIAELLARGIKPSYPQEKMELANSPIKICVQKI
ncbi:Transmembrane protein 59 [Mactra antiquata]